MHLKQWIGTGIFLAVSVSASGAEPSLAPASGAAPGGTAAPVDAVKASGAPASVPAASPALAPAATHPETPAKLTPEQQKSLLREFIKAQNTEIEAMRHRRRIELKELKASMTAREKEWNAKEKAARHKFFSENKGPARRTYMKDFLLRRETFGKMLKQEKAVREHDLDVRMRSVKEDQARRLKEFNETLSKGFRPSEGLWPQPN